MDSPQKKIGKQSLNLRKGAQLFRIKEMLKFLRTQRILRRKKNTDSSQKSKLLLSKRYHYVNAKADQRLEENIHSVHKKDL